MVEVIRRGTEVSFCFVLFSTSDAFVMYVLCQIYWKLIKTYFVWVSDVDDISKVIGQQYVNGRLSGRSVKNSQPPIEISSNPTPAEEDDDDNDQVKQKKMVDEVVLETPAWSGVILFYIVILMIFFFFAICFSFSLMHLF